MAMTGTSRVRVWWRIDDEDPECSTPGDSVHVEDDVDTMTMKTLIDRSVWKRLFGRSECLYK